MSTQLAKNDEDTTEIAHVCNKYFLHQTLIYLKSILMHGQMNRMNDPEFRRKDMFFNLTWFNSNIRKIIRHSVYQLHFPRKNFDKKYYLSNKPRICYPSIRNNQAIQ